MARKHLSRFGAKGRSVRVFTEAQLVRVQWREDGRLKTKSWSDTTDHRKAATAYARALAAARDTVVQPSPPSPGITIPELWDAFCISEFGNLRPATQKLYADAWKRWAALCGLDAGADQSPQRLDQLRLSMERTLAVNTVRMCIRVIKTVYAFGERRELLGRNRLASWRYKVSKERRPEPPPEFRHEEFRKLLDVLDPHSSRQWRARVALAICGYQGARQHAVLHLQWDDVDFDAGLIRWRAEWDKMGRDWTQPMRPGTRKALLIASHWRQDARWIVPGTSGGLHPYTKQSLWWMLRSASKRAGVAILRGRGAHGLRRMLAGDIAAATGDVTLALQAIGDTSLQMASRYVQPRADRVNEAFAQLDRNRTATPIFNTSLSMRRKMKPDNDEPDAPCRTRTYNLESQRDHATIEAGVTQPQSGQPNEADTPEPGNADASQPQQNRNPDFALIDEGTISLLRPLNPTAYKWLREHTEPEATWWSGSLVVEHRYVLPIAQGIIDEGFILTQE
jgi:integrase